MAGIEDWMKTKPTNFFGLTGVLLAIAFYYYQPPQDYNQLIIKTQNDLNQSKEKLRMTQDRAQNKEKFQKEMEASSQTFRQVLEYLPKELDMQDLHKKIYS